MALQLSITFPVSFSRHSRSLSDRPSSTSSAARSSAARRFSTTMVPLSVSATDSLPFLLVAKRT